MPDDTKQFQGVYRPQVFDVADVGAAMAMRLRKRG